MAQQANHESSDLFKNKFHTNMKSVKLTFIFLFLITGQTKAQSVIDIVRASNFYSQAVTTYDRGSYSAALKHLEDAETNLKGKTNRDLEYLKIMTSYNLKDYKTAYDLVQTYFEEGYEGRTQHFRNIDTYNEKHTISYNEKLTAIFVELEQKYSLVENSSHEDVLTNIVNRITTEKVKIIDFIQKITPTSARSRISVYVPSYYNENGKTYSYSFNFAKKGGFKDYVYYNENGGCTVKVEFEESVASVNKYSYRYGFNKSRQVGFTDCSKYSTYEDLRLKDKLEEINFVTKNSESYTINFTDNETLILEQGDNLKKLKDSLKQKGLL